MHFSQSVFQFITHFSFSVSLHLFLFFFFFLPFPPQIPQCLLPTFPGDFFNHWKWEKNFNQGRKKKKRTKKKLTVTYLHCWVLRYLYWSGLYILVSSSAATAATVWWQHYMSKSWDKREACCPTKCAVCVMAALVTNELMFFTRKGCWHPALDIWHAHLV